MHKVYLVQPTENSRYRELLEQIAERFPNAEIITRENPIVEQFQITRYPTVLILKKGMYLDKMNGVFPLQTYLDFINNKVPA
jgi:thioredoxin-like negative regulator of GroEL